MRRLSGERLTWPKNKQFQHNTCDNKPMWLQNNTHFIHHQPPRLCQVLCQKQVFISSTDENFKDNQFPLSRPFSKRGFTFLEYESGIPWRLFSVAYKTVTPQHTLENGPTTQNDRLADVYSSVNLEDTRQSIQSRPSP